MWHVVQTAPHGEWQVCRFLASHGLASYAPKFPAAVAANHGTGWVFPSYVFFRVLPGFARWDLVRWGPGVREVLQSDGEPAVVDDEAVARIRRRLASIGAQPATTLSPGQRVMIDRGPLRMVDAIFERRLDKDSRVQILIQLLGRPLTVEVDSTILRAVG